jgi:DNA-directed RNA polymerase subunit F
VTMTNDTFQTQKENTMLKHLPDIHPAANIFPMMNRGELEKLKEDILKRGLQEWGVMYNDQILDGRNRAIACNELDIEMQWTNILDEDYEEAFDPFAYVLSHNLYRRHLTTSQRAMVAAKLSKLKQGGDRKSEEIKVSNDTLKMDEASKQLNVGRATVARAKQVQEHGSESVKQAVEQGEIPVSVAAKLVKEVPDKKEQSKIVKQGPKAVKAVAGQILKKPPKKGSEGRANITSLASSARQFAQMAICQLERIQPGDEDRVESLRTVRDWIDNALAKV